MQTKRRALSTAARVACACAAALMAWGLLFYSTAIAQGIRSGLHVCAEVLIPSLFPFMALAGLITLGGYSDILSVPLRPLTKYVFRIPAELGGVVLLSMIGGYPVGARMLSNLLERGQIDKSTAERMLCFCVASGPSFLITAVGAGMLGSKQLGVMLFVSQTVASVLVGFLTSLGKKLPQPRPAGGERLRGAKLIVTAVSGAVEGMLSMCAFVVLFSGFGALIQDVGAAQWLSSWLPLSRNMSGALIFGLLEVTGGCTAAASLGGFMAIIMISMFASFGGLSVIFQVMACFSRTGMRFLPMVLWRFVHGGIASLLCVAMLRLFSDARTVSSYNVTPVMAAGPGTALMSACLLGMCTIFLVNLHNIFDKK